MQFANVKGWYTESTGIVSLDGHACLAPSGMKASQSFVEEHSFAVDGLRVIRRHFHPHKNKKTKQRTTPPIVMRRRKKRKKKAVRQKGELTCVSQLCLLFLLFLTNLHFITHNHNVGHSNTNTVPDCAVFWLGCAIPVHQAPSESTRKCPKALDIRLKLVDVSAANPYWVLS